MCRLWTSSICYYFDIAGSALNACCLRALPLEAQLKELEKNLFALQKAVARTPLVPLLTTLEAKLGPNAYQLYGVMTVDQSARPFVPFDHTKKVEYPFTTLAKPQLLNIIGSYLTEVEASNDPVLALLERLEVRRHTERTGLLGQHGVWACKDISQGTILGSYGGRLMTDDEFRRRYFSLSFAFVKTVAHLFRWSPSNPVNLMAHFYLWEVSGKLKSYMVLLPCIRYARSLPSFTFL